MYCTHEHNIQPFFGEMDIIATEKSIWIEYNDELKC